MHLFLTMFIRIRAVSHRSQKHLRIPKCITDHLLQFFNFHICHNSSLFAFSFFLFFLLLQFMYARSLFVLDFARGFFVIRKSKCRKGSERTYHKKGALFQPPFVFSQPTAALIASAASPTDTIFSAFSCGISISNSSSIPIMI